MASASAGAKFRAAVATEHPLQVIGAINAYTARMAERTGFKARWQCNGDAHVLRRLLPGAESSLDSDGVAGMDDVA